MQGQLKRCMHCALDTWAVLTMHSFITYQTPTHGPCLFTRGPHKDRMEIKRVGSQPTNVTITFQQDFAPPVYKVDQRLAEVSATGHQSKAATVMWVQVVCIRLRWCALSGMPSAGQ